MDQLDLWGPPPPLARDEARQRLMALIGQDLRPLADSYGVTVWLGAQRNKGWAGHTVERYLGRRPDSKQAPDFGDWELKVVSAVPALGGGWRLKESMAITAFSPAELEVTEFEDSHLLDKLGRLLVVARTFEDEAESRSRVLRVAEFDLDAELMAAVREDYEEIRWVVQHEGRHALGGRIGRFVHPRPRGGKDSDLVGFYAHKALVARALGGDVDG
jgi:DNA mismatch repair protein MutH